jgi:Glycosyl-4,4'-diaponeurosporenoate acyltransferase
MGTATTRITVFSIMQDSAKLKVINLSFRATFATMVFAFWTVPMIAFCVVVWRKGNIISTVAFLLCAGLGLMMFYLPEQYYRPKSFELNGQFYERLGIRFYKRWMMNGDYMNRFRRRFLPNHRVIDGCDSMRKFEAQSRTYEKGHLMWFIVTAFAGVYAMVLSSHVLALCLFVSSLVTQLYPAILQRYLRIRIAKCLDSRT